MIELVDLDYFNCPRAVETFEHHNRRGAMIEHIA